MWVGCRGRQPMATSCSPSKQGLFWQGHLSSQSSSSMARSCPMDRTHALPCSIFSGFLKFSRCPLHKSHALMHTSKAVGPTTFPVPGQGRVSPAWESISAPRHIFLMFANPFHTVTAYEVIVNLGPLLLARPGFPCLILS
jgi:hypothetical protein